MNKLRNLLAATIGVEFAVLVGSRANDRAGPDSDWDITLRWRSETPWMETVGDQETLRRQIAAALGTSPERIDLIDLSRAKPTARQPPPMDEARPP